MRRMWILQTRTNRRAEHLFLRPPFAGRSMSNGARAVAIAVTLALGTSGCTWWGEQNRTPKGAVYGTGNPATRREVPTRRAVPRRPAVSERSQYKWPSRIR